jgi:predicted membrane chloride channel (bestrophin family)
MDLTLLSIAIIFPLVFSIRGSFRRREKALEHLSEFKSTLHTVGNFLLSKPELVDLYKKDVDAILLDINKTVLNHLSRHDANLTEVDKSMNQVYDFVIDKNETISRQIRDKVFRFMKDMHECVENLNAIHIHRTPISLKAYCLIFIYIFPLIYAPEIIKNVGSFQQEWMVYVIVFITQFILISLYNIQNQLEYPFDNVGIDDIDLENFKLDR